MRNFFVLLCTLASSSFAQDTAQQRALVPQVVVTGQHLPQSLRKSVYQVKVISNETIRLHAPHNIQQVLNTELGFRFSNDLVLGTADVQLMGMNGRNVKVLVDGIPMVDRGDTRESLNQIDIHSVDRIEIVEGPMSVAYGTDALAGVINIISKAPLGSSFSIVAKLQEESAGKEYAAINGKGLHNQHLGLQWQRGKFDVMAGVTRNNFGGWKIGPPTATVLATDQWLPKAQWLANGRIGFAANNWKVWYRADVVKETIESRGAMNANNFRAKMAEYVTNRLSQQLQANWQLNRNLQITSVLGYTNLERATNTVIHDFTTNTSVISTAPGEQDKAKFDAAMIRTSLQYRLSDHISIQPGIEVSLDRASGARILGSPVIADYAFFSSVEIVPNSGISIRPGFRMIKNSQYDAPPIIPSINAKFKLSRQMDMRVGYANGFRSPALRELFYDFFDASHAIIGNPNLRAEYSDSFTGSLTWTPAFEKELNWSASVGAFYNHFTNRIDFGQMAADPSTTTLINIGKFKTTGSTFENTLTWKKIRLTSGFALIGRYNSLHTDAVQLPQFMWTPEITANLIIRLPASRSEISLYYKFNGSRPIYELPGAGANPEPVLIKTGAYQLADVLINKSIFKNVQLHLGVKNLFDVTSIINESSNGGAVHSSSDKAVPLSYGRSYAAGISYTWTKK